MEPNQALAYANQLFPTEARLRRCGYHLDRHVLTLTFDFPEVVTQRYASLLDALHTATGWAAEINLETNQSALNGLVREVLPSGVHIVKGPSIHREQKKVSVTVSAPGDDSLISAVPNTFRTICAWELDLTRASATAGRVTAGGFSPIAEPGSRLEINAAYSLIKSSLMGSSLYRASLKGDEIMLSFISPQMGERYTERIAVLEKQTGWALSINPQPNQGSILETARRLLNTTGLVIAKGPSIYPEKAEVTLSLASDPDDLASLTETFLAQTAYRLVINLPKPLPIILSAPDEAVSKTGVANVVEIPLSRIRLNSYSQSLNLDPDRLEKAVQRARAMGINPPIRVRRVRDGYVLTDGLYRLRAAETLGLERIPALVE
jgi:hypothetical protein